MITNEEVNKAMEEKLPMLTQKQIDEYKLKYKSFSINEENLMKTEDLGKCVRQLGFTPNSSQLFLMLQNADPKRLGFVSLENFLVAMRRAIINPPLTEQEVRSAFSVFDEENNGFIATSKLRRILVNIGDVFDENEIEEMIKHADARKTGFIAYNKFVDN